jgi:hypothetical protein
MNVVKVIHIEKKERDLGKREIDLDLEVKSEGGMTRVLMLRRG